MFPSRFLLSASVLAVATLATPAHAQQAGIQIALVDASTNQPAADIEVRIENADIGFARTARSDDQGFVRIEGLTTAGTYRVTTVAGGGYESDQQASVALRSNFTSSVTLRLAPVGAGTIVVTGARGITQLNTVNAEVSASLGKEELVALPIEGRDVLGSLVRLPNVVASTGFFPEAPSISINGSNGLDTNYLLDGLDNNENFLGGLKFPVPLGFTREVTVLANSYSVAYGRTANGVVMRLPFLGSSGEAQAEGAAAMARRSSAVTGLPPTPQAPGWMSAIVTQVTGRRPFRPNIIYQDTSLESVLSMISAKRFISVATESSQGVSWPELHFREIYDPSGPARLEFALYWCEDNDNPALQRFFKLVEERYPG